MRNKSGFVERFPELFLFYRHFSPLDSEMICIFPYFCPCEESAREIRDVFTGQQVKEKQYDVDHFIPWSFVMNDELWNLMPVYDSARRQGYEIWNYG